MLDSELDKIESFYLDREKEMVARSEALEGQVRELNKRRQLLQASEPQLFLLLYKLPHSQTSQNSTWLSSGFRDFIHRNSPRVSDSDRYTISRGKQRESTAKGSSSNGNSEDDDTTTEATHYVSVGDREDYHEARKQLQRAIAEHYRSVLR
jgi:xenotropic and polytropic retrovirus receptor 1